MNFECWVKHQNSTHGEIFVDFDLTIGNLNMLTLMQNTSIAPLVPAGLTQVIKTFTENNNFPVDPHLVFDGNTAKVTLVSANASDHALLFKIYESLHDLTPADPMTPHAGNNHVPSLKQAMGLAVLAVINNFTGIDSFKTTPTAPITVDLTNRAIRGPTPSPTPFPTNATTTDADVGTQHVDMATPLFRMAPALALWLAVFAQT